MGLLAKKVPPAWVAVSHIDEFTNTKLVVVAGKEYCLYKLPEGVFCTQNSCSHEYSPLCEGIVMDGEVYCPKHGSRFDIKTGAVINLPATTDIKTYQVKIDEGQIYIFV